MTTKLSNANVVVIPAHNEQENIGEIVQRTKSMFDGSILVINDGSTDSTDVYAREAGAIVISNPSDAEYGDGFETGLRFAHMNEAPIAIFMDAGGSHWPEDISRLVREMAAAIDIVIGSRTVPGAICEQTRLRSIITKIATQLVGRDYSGFRVIRNSAFAESLQIAQGIKNKQAHSFNIAFTLRAQERGLRMKEVPITYTSTNSTLNIQRFMNAAWALAVERRRRP